MNARLSQNQPVGGGSERSLRLGAGVVLKIAPLRGSSLTLDEYKQLIRYREYLSDDYCISCAYFQVVKGHFGICPDLPIRKAYDGTKKGSGCTLWRLRTVYLIYGIQQQLPEKPTIQHFQLTIVKRHARTSRRPIPKWLFSHPGRHFNKDVDAPWFWNWRLPKFVYDFLMNPEALPESIDLREPYQHYSDRSVWKDGKFRPKKPKPAPMMRTCCECGKQFEQLPNTKGLYCSRACSAKNNQKHRWGITRSQNHKVIKTQNHKIVKSSNPLLAVENSQAIPGILEKARISCSDEVVDGVSATLN
jgi:hypothetical protein